MKNIRNILLMGLSMICIFEMYYLFSFDNKEDSAFLTALEQTQILITKEHKLQWDFLRKKAKLQQDSTTLNHSLDNIEQAKISFEQELRHQQLSKATNALERFNKRLLQILEDFCQQQKGTTSCLDKLKRFSGFGEHYPLGTWIRKEFPRAEVLNFQATTALSSCTNFLVTQHSPLFLGCTACEGICLLQAQEPIRLGATRMLEIVAYDRRALYHKEVTDLVYINNQFIANTQENLATAYRFFPKHRGLDSIHVKIVRKDLKGSIIADKERWIKFFTK